MIIKKPQHVMQTLQEHTLGSEGAIFLNDHETVLAVETMALDTDRLTERALELGACALVVFQKRDMYPEQRVLSHLEYRRVRGALAQSNLRVMDWYLVNGSEFFSFMRHGLV